MRLIIIGAEYAGKSTLAGGIKNWLIENMGSCQSSFHDHFVPWSPEGEGSLAEKQAGQLMSLEPSLLECYQRYMIHYHMASSFYLYKDHCLVNWYYADAVYAPLYLGYGGPGEYADRRVMARHYDAEVMEKAPDTVLVLVKASPEVIRQRMSQDPQPKPFPKEQDIELVLNRFEEEFNESGIRRSFVLDTTDASAEQTLNEFVRQIEPHLAPADQLRMMAINE